LNRFIFEKLRKPLLNRMRILIAEDDVKAAGLLVEGLKAEGYAVDLARDGEEAMWLAETHPYDVMVFDVMMPAKASLL